MNCISTKYCKRRYKSLFGRSSLNGRYQAKEAYEIAALMQPAYCYAFIAKVRYYIYKVIRSKLVKMCVHIKTCLFGKSQCFDFLAYMHLQVTTVIASSLVMWLILVHPRFRRKM
ncbi:hypothetical protein PFISCL1PPCAC_12655, partial [Pristionchus fissidentatus]